MPLINILLIIISMNEAQKVIILTKIKDLNTEKQQKLRKDNYIHKILLKGSCIDKSRRQSNLLSVPTSTIQKNSNGGTWNEQNSMKQTHKHNLIISREKWFKTLSIENSRNQKNQDFRQKDLRTNIKRRSSKRKFIKCQEYEFANLTTLNLSLSKKNTSKRSQKLEYSSHNENSIVNSRYIQTKKNAGSAGGSINLDANCFETNNKLKFQYKRPSSKMRRSLISSKQKESSKSSKNLANLNNISIEISEIKLAKKQNNKQKNIYIKVVEHDKSCSKFQTYKRKLYTQQQTSKKKDEITPWLSTFEDFQDF